MEPLKLVSILAHLYFPFYYLTALRIILLWEEHNFAKNATGIIHFNFQCGIVQVRQRPVHQRQVALRSWERLPGRFRRGELHQGGLQLLGRRVHLRQQPVCAVQLGVWRGKWLCRRVGRSQLYSQPMQRVAIPMQRPKGNLRFPGTHLLRIISHAWADPNSQLVIYLLRAWFLPIEKITQNSRKKLKTQENNSCLV